ncbi:MAG: hypothetical protein V7634_722, partial [Bradyrhizobium sp.]
MGAAPRFVLLLPLLLLMAAPLQADEQASTPPQQPAPTQAPAPAAKEVAPAPKEATVPPAKEPAPPPSVTIIGAQDAHGV